MPENMLGILYCTFLDFIVCTDYFNIVILCNSDNVVIEMIQLTVLTYLQNHVSPRGAITISQ